MRIRRSIAVIVASSLACGVAGAGMSSAQAADMSLAGHTSQARLTENARDILRNTPSSATDQQRQALRDLMALNESRPDSGASRVEIHNWRKKIVELVIRIAGWGWGALKAAAKAGYNAVKKMWDSLWGWVQEAIKRAAEMTAEEIIRAIIDYFRGE